jgi:hypothetical protein
VVTTMQQSAPHTAPRLGDLKRPRHAERTHATAQESIIQQWAAEDAPRNAGMSETGLHIQHGAAAAPTAVQHSYRAQMNSLAASQLGGSMPAPLGPLPGPPHSTHEVQIEQRLHIEQRRRSSTSGEPAWTEAEARIASEARADAEARQRRGSFGSHIPALPRSVNAEVHPQLGLRSSQPDRAQQQMMDHGAALAQQHRANLEKAAQIEMRVSSRSPSAELPREQQPAAAQPSVSALAAAAPPAAEASAEPRMPVQVPAAVPAVAAQPASHGNVPVPVRRVSRTETPPAAADEPSTARGTGATHRETNGVPDLAPHAALASRLQLALPQTSARVAASSLTAPPGRPLQISAAPRRRHPTASLWCCSL